MATSLRRSHPLRGLTALDARKRATALAIAEPASPLYGVPLESIEARDGRMFMRGQPARGETYAAALARGGSAVEGRSNAEAPADAKKYSMHAFGAQFAEVRVDPDLGEVRLTRQVGAGTVFGAGMALLEHTATNAADAS